MVIFCHRHDPILPLLSPSTPKSVIPGREMPPFLSPSQPEQWELWSHPWVPIHRALQMSCRVRSWSFIIRASMSLRQLYNSWILCGNLNSLAFADTKPQRGAFGLALVGSHWFAANYNLEVSVKITLACGIHEMRRVRNMQAEGNIFFWPSQI